MSVIYSANRYYKLAFHQAAASPTYYSECILKCALPYVPLHGCPDILDQLGKHARLWRIHVKDGLGYQFIIKGDDVVIALLSRSISFALKHTYFPGISDSSCTTVAVLGPLTVTLVERDPGLELVTCEASS